MCILKDIKYPFYREWFLKMFERGFYIKYTWIYLICQQR